MLLTRFSQTRRQRYRNANAEALKSPEESGFLLPLLKCGSRRPGQYQPAEPNTTPAAEQRERRRRPVSYHTESRQSSRARARPRHQGRTKYKNFPLTPALFCRLTAFYCRFSFGCTLLLKKRTPDTTPGDTTKQKHQKQSPRKRPANTRKPPPPAIHRPSITTRATEP